jgi:hypothetical protein
MAQTPAPSAITRELVAFQAELHRLALALVAQALAAELARFRASLPTPAELAATAAELRSAKSIAAGRRDRSRWRS